jgi:hypothetical protein
MTSTSLMLILVLQLIAIAGWMFFVIDAFRTHETWVGFACLCTPFWIYYGLVEYDGMLKWWVLSCAVGAEVVSGAIINTYGN